MVAIVTEEPMTALPQYARVPIAFIVDVERWAVLRGWRQLKIETQNTNVGACRFYERQGCRLRTINRAACPDLPDEIQLLWDEDLQ